MNMNMNIHTYVLTHVRFLFAMTCSCCSSRREGTTSHQLPRFFDSLVHTHVTLPCSYDPKTPIIIQNLKFSERKRGRQTQREGGQREQVESSNLDETGTCYEKDANIQASAWMLRHGS